MDMAAFVRCLPPQFQMLRDLASVQGIGLMVVGGAIRDFLLKGLGPGGLLLDLDVEVYCSGPDEYQQLLTAAADKWQNPAQALKFQIYRWNFGPPNGVCLEISLPRRESYLPVARSYAHDQFQVDFFYGPNPVVENFYRRDFTINSLGVFFWPGQHAPGPQLVDYLGGLGHLQQGLLATANEDFAKDPLRLLRLARMQTRWPAWRLDQALAAQLGTFDLAQLDGNFYLWAEACKAADTDFFRHFFCLVDQYAIALPASYGPFRALATLPRAWPTTLAACHAWAHYHLPAPAWALFPWQHQRSGQIARRFFQGLAQGPNWLPQLQFLAAQGEWENFLQHPGQIILQRLWRDWQSLPRPDLVLPLAGEKVYQYLEQLKNAKTRLLSTDFPAELVREQRSIYRLYHLLAKYPLQE